MARGWRRRDRERVVAGLLSSALVEIRTLAFNPDLARHPDGHLAEIRMIADVCHNLAGAAPVRAPNEFDPFIWTWQQANADQKRWLREHLDDLGVDYSHLELAEPWPPPATAPAMGPRWSRRGWRFPRDPDAFIAVHTTPLAGLLREADALEPPGRKSPEWLLAHLHPDALHIVRACSPTDLLFLPSGPGDLRQFRGLLRMRDGAIVVGHLRLRESSFGALPANLSRIDRYRLAATPPRRRERDVYLWGRNHDATEPDCAECATATPAPPPT
jgi:hypothetical protein